MRAQNDKSDHLHRCLMNASMRAREREVRCRLRAISGACFRLSRLPARIPTNHHTLRSIGSSLLCHFIHHGIHAISPKSRVLSTDKTASYLQTGTGVSGRSHLVSELF